MTEYRSRGTMRVLDSFSRSLDHTRRMFFEPFDAGRWAQFGIIAFLALITGSGGCQPSFNFDSAFDGSSLRGAGGFIEENLALIVSIGMVVLLIVTAVTLALTWLSSRGTIMFIRAVGRNEADIGVNWSAAGPAGNQLFLFRMMLALLWIGGTSALGIPAFVAAVAAAEGGTEQAWPLLGAVFPFALVLAIFYFFLGIVGALTTDFAAPIMYKLDIGILDAWREFGDAARGNILAVVGYYLLAFVIWMPVFAFLFAASCCTCFIAALPAVHHVVFAPLYVFFRAIPLYMLADASKQYDVIETGRLSPERAAPPPPPPEVQ